MIGLIQRVKEAWVEIDTQRVATINAGMLVLIGVEQGDGHAQMERLLERLVSYRIFADDKGRMNLSLTQTGGGLLLVPQFTLVADTSKGNRPGFSRGAPPAEGAALFADMIELARTRHPQVASGEFGADMQVGLINDGPVTFWLQVPPAKSV